MKIDVFLRAGLPTATDIANVVGQAIEHCPRLYAGHPNLTDIILRPQMFCPGAVVEAGGGGFPTQFSGLKAYFGAVIQELCLVATGDAPTGMGGVPRIQNNGVTYAVYLVETGDSNASPIRIRTGAGTKAIRKKT